MTFANLSFEVAGDTPGTAHGWALSFSSSSTYAPLETFERAWGNDDYRVGFEGPFVDLTPARIRSSLATPQFVETFEEGWDNSSYAHGFAGITSPAGPETFEEGWISGDYLTDFAGGGIGSETFEIADYVVNFGAAAALPAEGFNETEWPLASSV